MHSVRLIIGAAALISLSACAPITPLPSSGIPMPTTGGLPSAGSPSASPSTPAGQPPSSSGGQQSGGQQSGGQQSGSSMPGGQSGGGGQGDPSSYDQLPSGGGIGGDSGSSSGAPGSDAAGGGADGSDTAESGADGAQEGTGDGSEGGNQSDPTWEDIAGTAGSAAPSDWDVSNELPGNAQGGQSSDPSGEQGGAGEHGDAAGSGGNASADEALAGALEEFDGEILAEREIARTGAAGTADVPSPTDVPLSEAAQDSDTPSGQLPTMASRSIPNAPPPPRRGAEGTPADLPDAKDDDIIARQLREAAMAEQDPELKEKLWEEYRKYKKG